MACSIFCGCNHLIFGVELFDCLPAAHRDWHRYPPVHIVRKRYTYSSRYRYDIYNTYIYIIYMISFLYCSKAFGANQQYDQWVDRKPPTPTAACSLQNRQPPEALMRMGNVFSYAPWIEWQMWRAAGQLPQKRWRSYHIGSHVGWYTLVFSFR